MKRMMIEDQYRTLGRRIYAGFMDGAILSLLWLFLDIVLLAVDPKYRFPVLRTVWLPLVVLYPIITTKIYGGTLGKLYFNIIVKPVARDGKISWLQSILRELINFTSSIADIFPVYIFYIVMAETSYREFVRFSKSSMTFQILDLLYLVVVLIEIATAASSKQRRSVHDLIAGTVVIKTGPYRPQSKVVAVGGFTALGLLAAALFTYAHN